MSTVGGSRLVAWPCTACIMQDQAARTPTHTPVCTAARSAKYCMYRSSLKLHSANGGGGGPDTARQPRVCASRGGRADMVAFTNAVHLTTRLRIVPYQPWGQACGQP
jgi:hypothetical protein